MIYEMKYILRQKYTKKNQRRNRRQMCRQVCSSCCHSKQAATVKVITDRIAAATQTNPLYSPGGANVHMVRWAQKSAPKWHHNRFGCFANGSNEDVMKPTKIRFHRIWISCFKSVGFGCGCATWSQLMHEATLQLHKKEIPHNTSFHVSLAHYYLLYSPSYSLQKLTLK